MTKKIITRSLKFSLRFSNRGKLEFLDNLWKRYHAAIKFFIDWGWEHYKYPTYQQVLEYTAECDFADRKYYADYALGQARRVLRSLRELRRSGHFVGRPKVEGVSMVLGYKAFRLERGRNSFDFWLKLRDPDRDKWWLFPVRDYRYRQERYEDWTIANTIELVKQGGMWYLVLIFKREVELREKQPIGIDLGYNKLLTLSDGRVFGQHIKGLILELDRKRQKSQAWFRKLRQIHNEVNRCLRRVIDGSFSPVVEALQRVKYKTRQTKRLNKTMRRRLHYWAYWRILKRIGELCEVAGVQWHTVPARDTSRTCPQCGYVDKANRRGEKFKCRRCGYEADADYVGAVNILNRYLTSLSGDSKGVYSPLACETCCKVGTMLSTAII